MIAYISGTLAEIDDKYIVVEAGGVGYGITVPATLPARLGDIGSRVKIYTHLQVGEDSQKLYGFYNTEERELFRLLISVSGVGPKVAISVLSSFSPDELRLAVVSEDEKSLSRAQGLGKKTAQKVILELRDKLAPGFAKGASNAVMSGSVEKSQARDDAIAAMVALGYSASEGYGAVSSLGDISGLTGDEILKAALRKLV